MSQLVRALRTSSSVALSLVRRAAFVAAGAALATTALPAQSIIASNGFDAGAEGWTLGDLFGRDCSAPAPTFVATGGNPGGFIRTGDVCNLIAFVAPTQYLGNRLDAFGGELRFSLRAAIDNPGVESALVVVTGAAGTLGFTTTNRPIPTAWTDYALPITVGSVRLVTGTTFGGFATEAEIRAVLADVTGLRIMADWRNGGDQTDLDTVSLRSGVTSVVPEPSTYALLVTGLAGVGVVARRRRRA